MGNKLWQCRAFNLEIFAAGGPLVPRGGGCRERGLIGPKLLLMISLSLSSSVKYYITDFPLAKLEHMENWQDIGVTHAKMHVHECVCVCVCVHVIVSMCV